MEHRSPWPDILSPDILPDITETTETFHPQESGISFLALVQVSSEMWTDLPSWMSKSVSAIRTLTASSWASSWEQFTE